MPKVDDVLMRLGGTCTVQATNKACIVALKVCHPPSIIIYKAHTSTRVKTYTLEKLMVTTAKQQLSCKLIYQGPGIRIVPVPVNQVFTSNGYIGKADIQVPPSSSTSTFREGF